MDEGVAGTLAVALHLLRGGWVYYAILRHAGDESHHRHPSLFIQERGMIVSLEGSMFKNTLLSQVTDVNGLGPLVRAIVSRGLQKLTQFGIPFSMSVSMEKDTDTEDETWSYAFVKIMIDGKYSDMLQNEVIRPMREWIPLMQQKY